MYDIAIIGAGINGCSVAYEFTQAGKKVLLLDMQKIAGGGSGAAGAFISPKFSKAGELKELLHDAFEYSMQYYNKHFPHLIKNAPLLHIAQNEVDAKSLQIYKQKSTLELLTPSQNLLDTLTTEAQEKETVSINAGLVYAELLCQAMAKSADYKQHEVKNLFFQDDYWMIDEEYSAKEVVLATGAYEKLIKEPYIKLRGVWGHRIDVRTSTQNSHSLHQFVSISASDNGKIAIGATHDVNYHPQTSKQIYDIQKGRAELLEKALQTLKLDNITIEKDYMGLRSGSFDYMPLVGRLVMSQETLKNTAIRFKTKKPDFQAYDYYPNLTMINGSGGYGFVLAPYLAKNLREYILQGKVISDRISPARFFARYAKKL